MNVRTYFILHTVIFVAIGLGIVAMPTLMADITGAALSEPEGIQLSRLLGITVASLGILTWVTRDLGPSKYLAGVVATLAIWHGMDAANMFFGILQHGKTGLAWAFPVIHSLVSIGFLAFLPGSMRSSQPV